MLDAENNLLYETTNLVSLTSTDYFLFGIEKIILIVLISALWDSMESDNVQGAPCSPVSLSSSDSDEDKSDSSASASPLPRAESYNKRNQTPILLPLLESSPFSSSTV